MMDLAAQFDALSINQLRQAGGVKFSTYPDAIGAFVAEMDFGTAPEIVSAVHKATDAGLFGYLPPQLPLDMSNATARWQRDAYGWDVPASRIHPVADVLKILELTILHFSKPGSAVIVPTPSYMKFLSTADELGRDVIEVPLVRNNGRDEMDLDGLDKAFLAGGHLLLLCNPFNPLGRVFSRAELLGISEVVERHGGRVFADEIHAPLVYEDRKHIPYASISPETAAHTITGTSAAKAWNIPGLKCAQIILSNDADAAIWEPLASAARHGASNLGVIANTVAYNEGAPWLGGVLSYLDNNRKILGEQLAALIPEIGYQPPEGTYVGWLDCRSLGLRESPADFFRERAGVALTDGRSCGRAGEGFVRFIFATPRPILEQALEQMAQALQRYRLG